MRAGCRHIVVKRFRGQVRTGRCLEKLGYGHFLPCFAFEKFESLIIFAASGTVDGQMIVAWVLVAGERGSDSLSEGISKVQLSKTLLQRGQCSRIAHLSTQAVVYCTRSQLTLETLGSTLIRETQIRYLSFALWNKYRPPPPSVRAGRCRAERFPATTCSVRNSHVAAGSSEGFLLSLLADDPHAIKRIDFLIRLGPGINQPHHRPQGQMDEQHGACVPTAAGKRTKSASRQCADGSAAPKRGGGVHSADIEASAQNHTTPQETDTAHDLCGNSCRAGLVVDHPRKRNEQRRSHANQRVGSQAGRTSPEWCSVPRWPCPSAKRRQCSIRTKIRLAWCPPLIRLQQQIDLAIELAARRLASSSGSPPSCRAACARSPSARHLSAPLPLLDELEDFGPLEICGQGLLAAGGLGRLFAQHTPGRRICRAMIQCPVASM